MFYGWTVREARKRKFARIITYILKSEDGTSLRVASWVPEEMTSGGSWSRAGRAREDKTSTERKVRWAPPWCVAPAAARHAQRAPARTAEAAIAAAIEVACEPLEAIC